jgi:rod shape-determining protein MreD
MSYVAWRWPRVSCHHAASGVDRGSQAMSMYVVVPLLVIVAVLQSSAISHLTILGVFPDLPLLMVVSWGLLQGVREAVLWGFIAGVAMDLLSGAPFGAATLSLMTAGLFAGLAKKSAFSTHVAFPSAVVFLATTVYGLVFLSIVWVSGHTVVRLDSLLRTVLLSALVNAALIPLVFAVLRLVHRRFSKEEMGW